MISNVRHHRRRQLLRKLRTCFRGGSEELFMKMAEEQNAKFLSVEEDDDF